MIEDYKASIISDYALPNLANHYMENIFPDVLNNQQTADPSEISSCLITELLPNHLGQGEQATRH